MATDFFEQQDSARGRTVQLVVFFVLGILVLIALVYGLLLVFGQYGAGQPVSWWQPELLLVVAVGVGILVGGASALKVNQLVRPPTRGRSGCSTSSRRWPSPRECRCLPSMF